MIFLKVISFLAISTNVFANQNEELIKLAVKNENIKNGFLQYNSSREEFYNSPEDKKKAALDKILKSKNCIYSLIPNFEKSMFRKLKERIDYRTEHEKAYELNDLIGKLEVKGQPISNLKDCQFKLNEQELKQFQAQQIRANSLIEENYKALMDYKANAHEYLKEIITTIESQIAMSGQLTANLSPLEQKDVVFKFFSMTVKNLENDLSKRIFERSAECNLIYKSNYEKECSKIKKYIEIPGANNRVLFCANDFKKKFKSECQTPLDILAR